jgi:hypothetical protein
MLATIDVRSGRATALADLDAGFSPGRSAADGDYVFVDKLQRPTPSSGTSLSWHLIDNPGVPSDDRCPE